MRTTLSLDDALLVRAKKRASERGLSLGGYVNEALRDHLSAPLPVAALVELPVATVGRLRPGIDPSSNRALFDALDNSPTSSPS